MLEAFISFICCFLLALVGFYIIKKITNYDEHLTLKVFIALSINSILIVTIHYMDYNELSVLLNFIINTITYKIIFKSNIEQAVIETAILTILVIVADIIDMFIQITFIPGDLLQNNIYIYCLGNILVCLIAFLLINIKPLCKKLNKVYTILSSKNLKLNIIFIFLIMIAISGIGYNFIINYKYNTRFFSDMLIMSSLIVISIVFVRKSDSYNKLSNEYDVLLSNVQTFEEWIEKEQFTRHEYKNQLAVLYALSSEKKVKEKIEEIINQNLKIEKEVIYELKNIPKGGIKGILYYKVIIAQKNKIKISIDVSIKEKGILKHLSPKKINEVSKIIGIYFDNAIEASRESKKKQILLEVYELKDKLNIIISNTFNKKSIIINNGQQGLSSKGIGRGNGLYFANKLLKDNHDWLSEKHEIIDNYYIETLTIKKSTSKK
ncbi:MAG: GHKL domain-containing protein [Bacilli bacterium]|nr:GHKL domain-containing protein [Bacilli bacterium]